MPRLIAVLVGAVCLSCSSDPPVSSPVAPASPAQNLSCALTFDIEVVYLSGERPLGETEKMLIELAAARWEAIITGDLPDVSFRSSPVDQVSPLLKARVQVNDWVDDIRIFVRVTDLPGNTGGSAWPTWTRRGSHLPIIAELAIDPDELDEELVMGGGFYKLVLHEIGHCLGFGTLWDDLDLLKQPSASGFSDPYFSGTFAWGSYLEKLGWPDDFNNHYPPVQAGGDDAHWQGSTFGDELMVSEWVYPYDKTLSDITLSSMMDLGYSVNVWAGDERYDLPPQRASKSLADRPPRACRITPLKQQSR